MTIKLSFPGITLNKPVTGKLISHDAEKKIAVIEFPDSTISYTVETTDENIEAMVGSIVTISTDFILSVSKEKKAAKVTVNHSRGCDEKTKRMFMQGH